MNYSIVTAKRAKMMGLQPTRHYGYYVLVTPKPVWCNGPSSTFGIRAWCKTKGIATGYVEQTIKYHFGISVGGGPAAISLTNGAKDSPLE